MILSAVHARISMPTLDEQQTVQLAHAQEDARFWISLSSAFADDLDGHKGLLATTQGAIAEREPIAADVGTTAVIPPTAAL